MNTRRERCIYVFTLHRLSDPYAKRESVREINFRNSRFVASAQALAGAAAIEPTEKTISQANRQERTSHDSRLFHTPSAETFRSPPPLRLSRP